MTLALPDDWTDNERLTVQCLVDSGTHSIVCLADYVTGLIAGGWLAPWRDDFHHMITFTPTGAAALGLTLDGDPARWMTRAQSRKLDEGPRTPPTAPGKVVSETDLNAAREKAGKSRRVVGDAAENRRIAAADGWRPANHGGLASPSIVLTEGLRGMDDWNGPLVGPCPVCGPRGGVRGGEYCCRCDYHWEQRKARRRAG